VNFTQYFMAMRQRPDRAMIARLRLLQVKTL